MARALELRFTDREITPWGGLVLMHRMLDKIRFQDALDTLDLPPQLSNRGHSPHDLITQYLIGVWCGATRFEYLEVTRHDHALCKIFDFKRMAGHRAFVRYFDKFTLETNSRVFQGLYRWLFGNIVFDNFTLDLDSTVITRYGEQEGARRGYNPQKRGRPSHHPLMAFVSDIRMVANCWLRAGDAHTANNFECFLNETLVNLSGKRVGLLRADSGFCSDSIMRYLEGRQIEYIIAARLHPKIQRMLVAHRVWARVSEGIDVAETEHKGRRMIMVRQRVKERPKATGKTLRLFADDEEIAGYRYGCYMTSLGLPAVEVWRLYRGRADAENRIKELKGDFGLEGFCVRGFSATEAAMNFAMLGYNLMSLFRQAVVCKTVHHTLKTLRYKVFAVGGYVTKDGSRRILRLALAMKRRRWFEGLWSKSGDSHRTA